ncbi:hypothetical protein COJ45_00590 [Bacillus cereus]|nr:hypothetical protein COJ45_00590 [Bacillus cereus]
MNLKRYLRLGEGRYVSGRNVKITVLEHDEVFRIGIFVIYPALMGSKTPTSKFSESKEVRWGAGYPLKSDW